MLKERRLFVEKLGLRYDPRFIREEVLFNGLLRGLQTLNFNYDIKDLETSSINALLKYKQLWLVSTEFMDSKTQQSLVSYVKMGGHLILYPAIPVYDEYLNPCTILKDELNIQYSYSAGANKVDAFGIDDIFTFFGPKEIFDDSNGEVVSVTKKGEVCGLRKKIGKGKLTTLGFAFGYAADEHLELIEKMVSFDKIKREAKISDPDIQFVIRYGKKHSYVFLLNYHNEKKKFTVDSKNIVLNSFSCTVIKRKK